MTSESKKAAGYVRVSTEKQKKDDSHHKQKRRLKNWAQENDYEIDFYEDIAVSGQSENREQYKRLMNNLRKYDAVVVRELSRFGRSLRTVLNDIKEINEKGIEFISLKENDIDTTTASGKAFLQMIGVFNEFWANLARERTQKMIERRKKQGKPIGRPKKIDNELAKEAKELYEEANLSYADIARLFKQKHGFDKLHRSTIKRSIERLEDE